MSPIVMHGVGVDECSTNLLLQWDTCQMELQTAAECSTYQKERNLCTPTFLKSPQCIENWLFITIFECIYFLVEGGVCYFHMFIEQDISIFETKYLFSTIKVSMTLIW